MDYDSEQLDYDYVIEDPPYEPGVRDALKELVSHPAWSRIASVIKLTYNKREKHDDRPHPHFDIPKKLVEPDFFEVVTHCPHCKATVHPVRPRMKTATRTGVPYPAGAYITMTCPQNVKSGCSKGNASTSIVRELESMMLSRVIR